MGTPLSIKSDNQYIVKYTFKGVTDPNAPIEVYRQIPPKPLISPTQPHYTTNP